MNVEKQVMNLNLKAVYFCFTSQGQWAKGYSIVEATKKAKVIKFGTNPTKYVVMAAVYNDPSDEELTNLFNCIVANEYYGSPCYYTNRTEEDNEMITRLHVGWLTVVDKSK